MDSVHTGLSFSREEIPRELNAIVNKDVASDVYDVLKLTGFDSPELMSQFCDLEDERFAGFVRELLVESGIENIKTTPDEVVTACILVKNSAKRAINQSPTPIQRRVKELRSSSAGPTPSCEETEVREMEMLRFSNSRDGGTARVSLRPDNRSQISDSPATGWIFDGPRATPSTTPPAPVCSIRPVTTEPEFLAFRHRDFFYADSRTLQACFRSIRGKAEISDFARLSFSKRRKRPATIVNARRLVREYYDFAFTCEPVTPLTGSDAIICMTRWLARLRIRGATAPAAGRYALRVFGEALGIYFSPSSAPQ